MFNLPSWTRSPPRRALRFKPPAAGSKHWWKVASGAALGLVAGVVAAILFQYSRTGPVQTSPRRFELKSSQASPLESSQFGKNIAISPDGSRIVYTLHAPRRSRTRHAAARSTGCHDDPGLRRWIRSVLFSRRAADWVRHVYRTEARRDCRRSKRHDLPDRRVLHRCQLGRQQHDCVRGRHAWNVPGPGLRWNAGADWRCPMRQRASARTRGRRCCRAATRFSIQPMLTDGSARILGRRIGATEGATVLEGGFGPQYSSRRLLFGQADRVLATNFDPAQFPRLALRSRSHQASSTNPLTA